VARSGRRCGHAARLTVLAGAEFRSLLQDTQGNELVDELRKRQGMTYALLYHRADERKS